MTRLFNLAAGMGLPSARYARFGQAHTGDLQKRRYTTLMDTPQPQPANTEANIRKAAEAIAAVLQMKQEFIRCPRIQHS
jgi:hypothetical protein